MNLQSILAPIVDIAQWLFKHILVPSLSPMNIICIIGGFVGLGLWLKMQKDFTAKAKKDGTIV
ncbi:MAG: hypothetical protein RL062_913 [Bacteroidota bacterium]|jgi:hypothetical protein